MFILELMSILFHLANVYSTPTAINLDTQNTTTPSPNNNNNLTLLHYHHSPRSLTKRDTVRILNHCEGHLTGWQFISSNCRRNTEPPETLNPQAYKIRCYQPAYHFAGVLIALQEQFNYGSCGHTEICVDGPNNVAACVSVVNYLRITTVLAGKQIGKIQIPADNTHYDPRQQALTVDAILTGPTLDTSVRAQTMSLTALKKLATVNNIPHYGPLPGGKWSCGQCWNIGPKVIKGSVDQFTAEATLVSHEIGFLYLTTFPS